MFFRESIREMLHDFCGHFDGGQHATFDLRVPGQDFRGAIDLWIRKPAFGGMNRFGRNQRALLAGIGADGLAVF